MWCIDVAVDGVRHCTAGAGSGVVFGSVTLTAGEGKPSATLLVRGLETMGTKTEEVRWLAVTLLPDQEITIRVRDAHLEEITPGSRVSIQDDTLPRMN